MTDPITAARLDEIEACVDNARSGPWILRDANAEDGFPRPAWVIQTPDREPGDEDVVIHVGDRCVGEFIELARAAVPELLAEVARLNARAAELDTAADRKNRLLFRLEEQRDGQRVRADQLAKELADLRPYAEAGKQLAAKQAESEYYHGTCDDCSCCTTAQCREHRCPENSIGESTCPCTCD